MADHGRPRRVDPSVRGEGEWGGGVPGSANVHDSLGEAYLVADRLELAERSYRRALDLDPRLDSARNALRRIAGRGESESVEEPDP